ncbi:MAG: ABC transporter permease subunit [Treponema sp.]|jgi:ABC-2 type transport system permease protein|nr:ABC transporter permease subunit [Treponema sp.]
MNQRFNRVFALVRKELYAYGISPACYGITVFFLLFVSLWLFYLQRFFAMNTATLRPFFAAFPLVFVLVIPVITMKSWAEERKLGSIELLLTLPFSEWDLVLGKFLSAFTVLSAIMAFTVPVPLSLLPLGSFDAGLIFGEYAGALLLGASATALGLLLSSLSKNQASSFLGSAVVLLAVMLINQLTLNFNLPSFLAEAINFISLSFHFESFSRGVIDSRDLAFFLLTTVLFLFLNTRVLLFRRWS